jgi:hypothetical protein
VNYDLRVGSRMASSILSGRSSSSVDVSKSSILIPSGGMSSQSISSSDGGKLKSCSVRRVCYFGGSCPVFC